MRLIEIQIDSYLFENSAPAVGSPAIGSPHPFTINKKEKEVRNLSEEAPREPVVTTKIKNI